MRELIKWLLLCKLRDDASDIWTESDHSPASGFLNRYEALRVCRQHNKQSDSLAYCLAPLHNCVFDEFLLCHRLKDGFDNKPQP